MISKKLEPADISDSEKAFWTAIVEVKCCWSIRRSPGRLPIPLIVLSSGNDALTTAFAERFGLSCYRQGRIRYSVASGQSLYSLLLTLGSTHFRFRRKQYQAWLNLCGHITHNRGTKNNPLGPEVIAQRLKLALLASKRDFIHE